MRKDSTSDPARGLGAAYLTQHVSPTLPTTLLGGWAPPIEPACLRDSASDLAWELGATYLTRHVSVALPVTLLEG
jgi:hypothetical protein